MFAFLRDLRRNNDRAWFGANRSRYDEAVQEPALEFISDFAPRLHEISPHFRADARPSGGSLFRIYRDTRFSKDKSPYKTNTGIHFSHELGKDVHAPTFYLHLAPDEVFAAVGVWHPGSGTQTKIRDAIVGDADRWTAVTRTPPFADVYRLGGDSLKRAPADYDADHALIEDLKRKDFIGIAMLSEDAVTADGFLDEYARMCHAGAPLVEYLCDALGVPF